MFDLALLIEPLATAAHQDRKALATSACFFLLQPERRPEFRHTSSTLFARNAVWERKSS